jgi:hypothetical protein
MKQNKGWRPLGRLFASSVQDLFFTDIVIIHIYTTGAHPIPQLRRDRAMQRRQRSTQLKTWMLTELLFILPKRALSDFLIILLGRKNDSDGLKHSLYLEWSFLYLESTFYVPREEKLLASFVATHARPHATAKTHTHTLHLHTTVHS